MLGAPVFCGRLFLQRKEMIYLLKEGVAMDKIVLFDGDCNLCDHSVQFIIKRDPKEHFKFTSLQSDMGKKMLNQFNVPEDTNSFILIANNKTYSKSSAALQICKDLKGLWKIFHFLLIIPRPIRDLFYGILANNRYKWFGKKDSCTLPSPEIRKRFL